MPPASLRVGLRVALGLVASAFVLASHAAPPGVALRMDAQLTQLPEPRAEREAPPDMDRPAEVAAYYFERYPEIQIPGELLPGLARYYLQDPAQPAMPAGLLDAIVHYYAVLHPELRPPAGLYARLGELEATASGP